LQEEIGKVWRSTLENAVSRSSWAILVGTQDQNANSNTESTVQLMRFKWEEDSIRNWIGGHAVYILIKSLCTFCLCPETFSEAEFKK
jgi:hypothetical protein